jgi:hypothetical protein
MVDEEWLRRALRLLKGTPPAHIDDAIGRLEVGVDLGADPNQLS